MKFNDFLKYYNNTRLINSSTFVFAAKNPHNLRRQVRYWRQKGYLISLKRGVYIFNDDYRKKDLSRLFLANFLVSPSYLSLEYALGFYGLIPEKVTVFTSVTTKKPQKYINPLGAFEYRSLKKCLFFGYKKEVDNEQPYFIALPEKALLDYFYLSRRLSGDFAEFESIRLQNLERLNIARLKSFSLKYNQKTRRITTEFIKFIKEDKKKYKVLK